MEQHKERAADHEPAPFLRQWKNIYIVIIVELALTVALLYLLSRWAS